MVSPIPNNGFIVKENDLKGVYYPDYYDLIPCVACTIYEGEYIFRDTYGSRVLNTEIHLFDETVFLKRTTDYMDKQISDDAPLKENIMMAEQFYYYCNINNLKIIFPLTDLLKIGFGSNEQICEIVESGF